MRTRGFLSAYNSIKREEMRHEINLRELRVLCKEFPWLLGNKVAVNDIVLCALKPEYIPDIEQPITFGQVCRLLCWRVLYNSINNMHININTIHSHK